MIRHVNNADVVAHLNKRATEIDRALLRGGFKFGHTELTEMKRRCPVEFGILKGSGEVLIEWHGKNLRITWSFGGAAADYAMYVHEDLDAFHENGQAKYIESVTNESAQYAVRRILDAAEETLGL